MKKIIFTLLITVAFSFSAFGYVMKYGELSRGKTFTLKVPVTTYGEEMEALVWLGVGGTLDGDIVINTPQGQTKKVKSGAEASVVKFKRGEDGTYIFNVNASSGSGSFILFIGSESEWSYFTDWLESQ